MENTEQENKTQGTPVDVIVKKELENVKSSPVDNTAEEVKTEASPPVATPEPVVEQKSEPVAPVNTDVPVKQEVATEPAVKAETRPAAFISGAEEKTEDIQQSTQEETPALKQAPVDTPEEDLPPLAKQPGSSDDAETTDTPEHETSPQDATPAAMGIAASQMGKSTHPHRNNKKLAVIMTVVVALTLSAIAVYVYMSTNKNTESDKPASPVTQQLPTAEEEQDSQSPIIQQDLEQPTQDLEDSRIEPAETETLPDTETP